MRSGVTALGVADAQVTLKWERLIGWRGAGVFFSLLDTHGGSPSAQIGDVQGVSNLQAPAALRLEEAWLQQNPFGNRLSLLVGRYDLSTEFYHLQSATLFENSSFGIGPEFAQSGTGGPSIFPNTAVGTRIAFKPRANAVLRVAVLDGAPVGWFNGGPLIFAPGDGALLVGEVALLSRPDIAGEPRRQRFQIGRGTRRSYAAKLALGAWYYTAQFPDLADTLSSGVPVRHRGSSGIYLIADQTLRSASDTSSGPLTAFVQLGFGDGRVNQVDRYVGIGLTRAAPFFGRSQDELGLAVAAAHNGSLYERANASPGAATASETAVELTYLAQLLTWMAVQPDVQYVIHPGGKTGRRNATVFGLTIGLSH